MNQKTSITLSKDLLARVDRQAGPKQSRSAFTERVLRRYFHDRRRTGIQARDLELLNQAADRLNREADEILEYQAPSD
jgi:metal-responsive CopG/Arc/MetJ family transcriptional regulator